MQKIIKHASITCPAAAASAPAQQLLPAQP